MPRFSGEQDPMQVDGAAEWLFRLRPLARVRVQSSQGEMSTGERVLVVEHAAIFLGKERIGTAPGPVKVKRGSEKVKLTLKADGYTATDIELEPSDNTVLSVKLPKVARVASPIQTTNKELEDPFHK